MHWMILAVVLLVGSASAAAPEAQIALDEARLQQAGIKHDGDSLLQFFKQRTVKADQQQIRALVRQLSSRSYQTREKASTALIAAGAKATAALREATRDPELEVRRRAETCLDTIRASSQPELTSAAGRLLGTRKPAGAADVLLDFLPSVIEEAVVLELHGVLAALAVRDGKVDPALIRALRDDDALRRAAAAAALCRAGVKDQFDRIKPLLADREPIVRLHAGIGLLRAGDKNAVPVLIDLLPVLTRSELWAVEDDLYRLAEDKAPSVAFGDTEQSRKEFRDGWAAWWKKEGERLDVAARLKEGRRDWTLIVLLDEGEILEVDAKDKERFRMSKVGFPLDAQTLPGDRVLVAEHGAGRVTERLRDGTILWEKRANEPLVAQRLEGGITFIATKHGVMEVDREGRTLFSWNPPGELEQIMRAKKLADGNIAIILHNAQRYTLLDPKGKEIGGFGFPVNVQTYGGRVDVQPNGNVLIPQMYMNKVIEYDNKGKVVKEFTVSQPIVAARLPGGNTIVTSMNENRAVELDATGKQVWEYKAKTRVTRAYRR